MFLNNLKGSNFSILRRDNTIPPVAEWVRKSHSLGGALILNVSLANNIFFLGANVNGAISYTTDGDTYTTSTISAVSLTTYKIIWDGTRYVSSHNGMYIYSSTNLSSWTERARITSESSSHLRSITFSPTLNLYVTVGDVGGIGRIYTSSNLTSWSLRLSPFGSVNINDVIWQDDKFIAVSNGGKIAISTNGIDWSLVTSPVSENIISIKFLDNKFYAVHYTGILVSSNGVNWTNIPRSNIGISSTVRGIDFDPIRRVFIICSDINATQSNMTTTKDFISYDTKTISPVSAQGIVYNNNLWITAGSTSGNAFIYVPV